MNQNLSLFGNNIAHKKRSGNKSPLADRIRPDNWEDIQGLENIDSALLSHLKSGQGIPPSIILWGPPGCGKTTFAKLVGTTFDCNFVEFSAVLGGVKEVRQIVNAAVANVKPTILFVDEIHRFNKSQQDAFLPHVENGTIILLGATTENPSFSLNAALLSRMRVVVLKALDITGLIRVLKNASAALKVKLPEDSAEVLANYAAGDARRAINALEGFIAANKEKKLTRQNIVNYLKDATSLLYDKSGEEHYNMISAFIKSLRGTDPDAALFWGFRMLESGEDPRFLIRRMLVFASEDIGNADPRALMLANATSDAYERLGLPEGRIPIAQCITYLACAPKSNRSYSAMLEAIRAARENPRVTVPLHIRNAPTKLMKELDYGKDYQYPHSDEEGYIPGINYLPEELNENVFYEPSENGLEKKIKEKLDRIRSRTSS